MRSYTQIPTVAYTGGLNTSSKITFSETFDSYSTGSGGNTSTTASQTFSSYARITRNEVGTSFGTTQNNFQSFSGTSRTTATAGTTTASESYAITDNVTSNQTSADTSFSYSGSNLWISNTSTTSTQTSTSNGRTYLGQSTSIQTSNDTLDSLQDTRYNTNGLYDAIITTSYLIPPSRSSWTTSTASSGNPTELSIYAPDSTDPNFNPLTTVDSSTVFITTTSVTLTNHAFSPYRDTVFYLDAGIVASQYNHPIGLWSYKTTATEGFFTDLFGSVSDRTYTLSDYQLFSTSSEQATLSTVSRYTTISSTTTVSGTGTTTTNFTDFQWSFNNTSSNFISDATSNNSTTTITFSINNVGSSVVDDQTIFTHPTAVSGYSNNSFTSTTTSTQWGGEITREVTWVGWYTSRTRQDSVMSRYTAPDTILVSKFTTVGASPNTTLSYLGKVSTTSMLVYTSSVSTTVAEWPAHLNQLVTQYQIASATSAEVTSISQTGAGATSSGITNTYTLQYFTSAKLFPLVGTKTNTQQLLSPLGGFSGVSYRVSARPNGYIGFGGGHTQNQNLSVFCTVSASLVTGSEFTGITINATDLKTRLMHPNLTVFPVETDEIFTIPDAQKAKYVSTVSGLGGALIDVTWTKTSTTNVTIDGDATTALITVSLPARYSLEPTQLITGDFFTEGSIASSGLGNPYPDAPWSITIGGVGRVTWSNYSGTGTSAFTTVYSLPDAFTSFTLASNQAVAYIAEPLLTASLQTGDFGHQYSTRTRYI